MVGEEERRGYGGEHVGQGLRVQLDDVVQLLDNEADGHTAQTAQHYAQDHDGHHQVDVTCNTNKQTGLYI